MNGETNEEKIKEILERGVAEIIERERLMEKIRSKKKLRVKFGIDPTSADLHLGHAVLLRKLKQFQDVGHKAVLIIGDFTAQIGDPSGRSVERKMITAKEVKNNLKKYLKLAGKIIDVKKTEVVRNSRWFSKNGLKVLMDLAGAVSVQQVLKRADFQKRMEEGNDITLREELYPLFQGYDSVMVKADVEIGGADQKFNLLMGRRIQRHFGIPEQDIITMGLLEGTDGVKKMSKVLGNYIALDEKPNEMFGKLMSIPDGLVEKYFLLLTDLSGAEINNMKEKMSAYDFKNKLAENIVAGLYTSDIAASAKENFKKTFSQKGFSGNAQFVSARAGEKWEDFLSKNKLASSKSEARRLLRAGAVELNGKKVSLGNAVKEEGVARIGKHLFIKIKLT